jgi:hypothetical protein
MGHPQGMVNSHCGKGFTEAEELFSIIEFSSQKGQTFLPG